MSENQIDRLLEEWEEARDRGIDLSPDDLCADCPECIDEVRDAIRKLVVLEALPNEIHAQHETIPSQIGDFHVIRQLGRGGFGVVYLCRQDSPERQVAVKVLQTFNSQERRRRFEREANTLAKLRHVGIAKIFEFGELPVSDELTGTDTLYLAMEYVDGETPVEFSHGKSLKTITGVLVKLLTAVSHAHQNGIIHRDIKPSNVVVQSDGEPKLLDFGIAKLADPNLDTLTRRGDANVLGTLRYMSPEQISTPKDVDIRTDIYAVAALAYEMYTGQSALDLDDSDLRVHYAVVMNQEPRPMSSCRADISKDLATIIGKGLRKDADDRYQSAFEFAEDLKRYLRGDVVMARPVRPWERLWKWANRNPLPAALAILSVTAILLAFAVSIRSNRVALRLNQLAETRLRDVKRTNFNLSLATSAKNLPLDPISASNTLLDPDSCPPELRDFSWELLRKAADQTFLERHAFNEPPTALVFADERPNWLFAGFKDGQFVLLDNKTRKIVTRHKAFADRVYALGCSVDGSCLVVGSSTGDVTVYRMPTGEKLNSFKRNSRVKAIGCVHDSEDFYVVFNDGVYVRLTGPDFEVSKEHSTGLIIRRIALSPDNSSAIVSTKDRRIAFIEFDSGELTFAQEREERLIHGLGYLSPNRALEFSGLNAHLWDIETGRSLGIYHSFPTAISRFCNNSLLQLGSSRSGDWFLRPNSESKRFHHFQSPGSKAMLAVALSSDGRWIALSSDRRPMTLWDLKPLTPPLAFSSAHGPLSVAFDSPQSKYRVVAATNTATLVYSDLENAHLHLKLSKSPLTCLAVGEGVSATGGQDGIVYVVDPKGAVTAELPIGAPIKSLAFLSRSDLMIGDKLGRLLLSDIETGEQTECFRFTGAVQVIKRIPDSRVVIGVDRKGLAVCYDLESRSICWKKGQMIGVHDLEVSRTKDKFFTLNRAGRICIRDASTGEHISDFIDSNEAFTQFALSPDEKTLATVDRSGFVDLWDPTTGQRRLRLDGHVGRATSIEFSSDGRSLVTCGQDSKINVWSVEGPKSRSTPPSKISPRGRREANESLVVDEES